MLRITDIHPAAGTTWEFKTRVLIKVFSTRSEVRILLSEGKKVRISSR